MKISDRLPQAPGRFDIIASTGRTATTFLAAALDQMQGVAATHEGYRGSDKDTEPLLPLVNLQNAAAYASEAAARQTVADLRNDQNLAEALQRSQAERLIDVAYYNAMIGAEILAQHPTARMIGIIRDCESFVCSATAMEGEDPLPVGWPDPDKPLTDREKFIAMGRIRPGRKSPLKAEWAGWSAIRRNIWLWRETNLRLCAAQQAHGARVVLLRFSTFQKTPEAFWDLCADFLQLPYTAGSPLQAPKKMVNKKPLGYQIGAAPTWTSDEQAALDAAQTLIEKTAHYAL
ncbi:hypothetical protein AB838_06945 [Rhodobacteraceae bacterium (ex Bugula neritina AB1)]|nr:hypothetical protein AB838_06945 [Rhodobacteraceae bacterium (ex Bugula neritina AB1)]